MIKYLKRLKTYKYEVMTLGSWYNWKLI
jgi:hypothetical protein